MDELAISALRGIFGGRLRTSREERVCYSYDATGKEHLPDAVAFPETAEEVRRAILLANELRFPVIPRGAGSGFSGGSVPVRGGLVLSTERMDRILSIDEENLVAVVEPGVVTERLKEEVRRRGLFYPPDPASQRFCTIGGNIAECAGGMCAVKYGVTRDYVLGLEAVLGTGELIRTGVSTVKGVVGYDLTRMLVGSEGTLGVVTKATLRLIPHPETVETLVAFFRSNSEGSRAVAGIVRERIVPCALEMMDRTAIDCVREAAGLPVPEETGCALLIEVDGPAHSTAAEAVRVEEACLRFGAVEVRRASDADGRERLWKLRRSISPALRKVNPVKINEDIVVPRSRLPAMMDFLSELAVRKNLKIVTFGHAGDGNVHVNLMLSGTDLEERRRADEAVAEIFRKTIELGGTISGEHGIGISKAPFLEMEVGPLGVSVMKRLKACFDPNGILNPGKIFPDEQAVRA
ncbi:MAG TPA: glycolate oxidase subunit GlcD [Deltaproteobacteria bacterium]|nr:MAG: glycolate oxidase subunit GlcD [Deltaproteobacteria bacterium GWC2_65_14]HBO70091.1 glycolate oxidase subunit GlcD [Deltaproteobacteria bacterium]